MSIAENTTAPADQRPDPLSVEAGLAAELDSPVKRECVGGTLYPTTGARNLHNTIASNVLGALYSRLHGKRCRAFTSDTKIRLRLPSGVRFYYPDASVTCHPNSPDKSYQDQPAVVVEVLSRGTRRIDEREKKAACLTIPTLSVYLLVEQESASIVAFRRTQRGFEREIHRALDAVVPLPKMETELPLKEVYEAVQFVPEPEAAD